MCDQFCGQLYITLVVQNNFILKKKEKKNQNILPLLVAALLKTAFFLFFLFVSFNICSLFLVPFDSSFITK